MRHFRWRDTKLFSPAMACTVSTVKLCLDMDLHTSRQSQVH